MPHAQRQHHPSLLPDAGERLLRRGHDVLAGRRSPGIAGLMSGPAPGGVTESIVCGPMEDALHELGVHADVVAASAHDPHEHERLELLACTFAVAHAAGDDWRLAREAGVSDERIVQSGVEHSGVGVDGVHGALGQIQSVRGFRVVSVAVEPRFGQRDVADALVHIAQLALEPRNRTQGFDALVCRPRGMVHAEVDHVCSPPSGRIRREGPVARHSASVGSKVNDTKPASARKCAGDRDGGAACDSTWFCGSGIVVHPPPFHASLNVSPGPTTLTSTGMSSHSENQTGAALGLYTRSPSIEHRTDRADRK